MLVYSTGDLIGPKFIINFPTKQHWKGKSKIADIDQGLDVLVKAIQTNRIKSIAVPPLGCGNGGLDWSVVRKLIERKLGALEGVDVQVFEPAGAPANREMVVATSLPNMTQGRAALLGIFDKYLLPGYELTMLEIQKLSYFLQEAGEPLRLKFVKDKYGPYSETLHHVLQRMEGHFIRGYGDRSRDTSVEVIPTAVEKALEFLKNDHPDTLGRADRVEALIEGFETPFGLELLSTVHWVLGESPSARTSLDQTILEVHSWNERKAKIFSKAQIELAKKRLQEQGWAKEVA